MASAVPPLNFPKGSQDSEMSPRLNEKMTPRSLSELVKENPEWAALLKDAEADFKGRDIIDVNYQIYLKEVVPVMKEGGLRFKDAVNILALSKQGKMDEKLRADVPKEEAKGQAKDVKPPKLVEEEATQKKDVDTEKPEPKEADAKGAGSPEPKARNADSEHKSLGTRKMDSKAGGSSARSSSEPVTPGRMERAEKASSSKQPSSPRRDRRPSTSIAIQTELPVQEASSSTSVAPKRKASTPRGGGSLALRQPLLASAPKPKSQSSQSAQRQLKKAKQEAEMKAKYEDCSCERVLYSSAARFMLAFVVIVATGSIALGFIKIKVNSGHKPLTNHDRGIEVGPTTELPKDSPYAPLQPVEPDHKEHHAASVKPTTAPHKENKPSVSLQPSASPGKEHAAVVTSPPPTPKEPKEAPGPTPSALPKTPGPAEPMPTSPPAQNEQAADSRDAGAATHPAPAKPQDPLQSAKQELKEDLEKLEYMEEEQEQTTKVGALARLSQKENEAEARSQNKKIHMQKAALDAEVQARIAMTELRQDQAIQKQENKVKRAEEKVDDIEAAMRRSREGQKPNIYF